MEGLAVVVRLAREALEREGRALCEIDQSLIEAGDRIRELDGAAATERRVALSLDGGGALLATYLEANRHSRRAAARRLAELEQMREAQVAQVLTRRLELERLELLAARRLARERVELARREQKAIDELVAMRTRSPR